MKKLVLGLGSVAAVAAPIATVVACGSDHHHSVVTIATYSKDGNTIKANVKVSGDVDAMKLGQEIIAHANKDSQTSGSIEVTLEDATDSTKKVTKTVTYANKAELNAKVQQLLQSVKGDTTQPALVAKLVVPAPGTHGTGGTPGTPPPSSGSGGSHGGTPTVTDPLAHIKALYNAVAAAPVAASDLWDGISAPATSAGAMTVDGIATFLDNDLFRTGVLTPGTVSSPNAVMNMTIKSGITKDDFLKAVKDSTFSDDVKSMLMRVYKTNGENVNLTLNILQFVRAAFVSFDAQVTADAVNPTVNKGTLLNDLAAVELTAEGISEYVLLKYAKAGTTSSKWKADIGQVITVVQKADSLFGIDTPFDPATDTSVTGFQPITHAPKHPEVQVNAMGGHSVFTAILTAANHAPIAETV